MENELHLVGRIQDASADFTRSAVRRLCLDIPQRFAECVELFLKFLLQQSFFAALACVAFMKES